MRGVVEEGPIWLKLYLQSIFFSKLNDFIFSSTNYLLILIWMLLSASSKCLKVGIPWTSTDGLTNDGDWQSHRPGQLSLEYNASMSAPTAQLPSCGLVSGPRLANWQILLTFCLQHEGASINLLQQFIHYLFRILQIYFEFYPIFPTSSRYLGMMMMMMMGSTKHLVWVDIIELFAPLRWNRINLLLAIYTLVCFD